MGEVEANLTDRHRHDRNDDDGESVVLAKTQTQELADVVPAADDRVTVRRHGRHVKVVFLFVLLLLLFDQVSLPRNVVENKPGRGGARNDALFAPATVARVD